METIKIDGKIIVGEAALAYEAALAAYDRGCEDIVAHARRLHRRIPQCYDPFARRSAAEDAARRLAGYGY